MVVWLIIKFLGAIDLAAAYIIFAGTYDIPLILKAAIVVPLFLVGITNFFYKDVISIIDGITDLASVFLIITAFPIPGFLKLILILIMVEKGLVSIF